MEILVVCVIKSESSMDRMVRATQVILRVLIMRTESMESLTPQICISNTVSLQNIYEIMHFQHILFR